MKLLRLGFIAVSVEAMRRGQKFFPDTSFTGLNCTTIISGVDNEFPTYPGSFDNRFDVPPISCSSKRASLTLTGRQEIL